MKNSDTQSQLARSSIRSRYFTARNSRGRDENKGLSQVCTHRTSDYGHSMQLSHSDFPSNRSVRKAQSSGILRFANFEADLRSGELRKQGIKIKLHHQPFQVLAMLLEHPGEVVTREELKSKLWPLDTFVDFDVGLNSAVKRLRDALGDSAEIPRYVETLPRRGYRFIAPVSGIDGAATPDKGKGGDGRESLRRFRWIVAVVSLAVLAATLFAFNVFRVRERVLNDVRVPPIQSLAVLPLTNLSGDPAQEYFSDGMTDALITEVAQLGSLKVISRTSSMRFRRTDKSLPEIARELNVDGIVEGTVQRSGDRVRITAQLIYGPADKHLWASSYERNLQDVLAVQEELARAIVSEIKVKLTPQEQVRLGTSHLVNPEAYEVYLRGLAFSRNHGCPSPK